MNDAMCTLALTMGDPAGIGPELAVRAAADPEFRRAGRMVLYGDPEVFRRAAVYAGVPEPSREQCVVCREAGDFVPAEAQGSCGLAAYDAVKRAALDALAGKVDAIVTAPMNKYAVNLAGIAFSGHTELLDELCGGVPYAMMQSANDLRVAFVTTHIALGDVPRLATRERIVEVGHLLDGAIRAEGVAEPRIAVCAINPHAGENGCMGREDEENVKPAVAQLRCENVHAEGPFPPDVMFIESFRKKYDGILSMYHDQGHIPFKMLAFDRGVNSTLGLPIIRTSPDHGTAFDIAWKHPADPGSFYAAVRLALRRAQTRKLDS